MEWENAGGDASTAGADWSFSPESLFTASAVATDASREVRRAETAPTIMTEMTALADDDIPQSEAYRCTPEYHYFYYSHMPRDPRMPIPIKRRTATNSQQAQPQGQSSSTPTGSGGTPWNQQKSSLTGDIVSCHPRSSQGMNPYHQVMPGRVVTPATAQQMLNDPHTPIPHGSRVVYVTEPPKAVTPSTIYVLLPEGTAPPPGATVIHAPPPSFISGEPSRVGSGVSHIVSANGQILIASSPSPPNQFQGIPQLIAPHPQPMASGPTVMVGTRAQLNHPLMMPAASSVPQGGTTVPRHPLLQQYIDTKMTADWNVRLIVGHIPHFCRDQDGSRFIQRQLDSSGENVPTVWNEVLPIALDLMCDVFGNYVIQKLFDVADDERRVKLVGLFRGNIMKLSLQTYGCRVLQKAFDTVASKHMSFVAEELRGNVPCCVFDQNANHVLQKCIEKLASKCQFVADEFLEDLLRLSCHAYGCRVLQKLFEACYYDDARVSDNPYAPTDLTVLITTVFEKLDELVLNQFGNYVVQHGMMNCSGALQRKFIGKISPAVFQLSKSKFGSNVAEKAVELASEAQRSVIIDGLIGKETPDDVVGAGPPPTSSSPPPPPEPPLVSMMRDPFANYVVQKLMDRSCPDQQARMVRVILPHVAVIAQATFGKHLLNRMDKMGLLPPSVVSTFLHASKDSTNGTSGGGREKNNRGGAEKKKNGPGERSTINAKQTTTPASSEARNAPEQGLNPPDMKPPPKRKHRRQRSTASSGFSGGTPSARATPTTSPGNESLTPPSHALVPPSLTSSRVMQHMPYRSPPVTGMAPLTTRSQAPTAPFSLDVTNNASHVSHNASHHHQYRQQPSSQHAQHYDAGTAFEGGGRLQNHNPHPVGFSQHTPPPPSQQYMQQPDYQRSGYLTQQQQPQAPSNSQQPMYMAPYSQPNETGMSVAYYPQQQQQQYVHTAGPAASQYTYGSSPQQFQQYPQVPPHVQQHQRESPWPFAVRGEYPAQVNNETVAHSQVSGHVRVGPHASLHR